MGTTGNPTASKDIAVIGGAVISDALLNVLEKSKVEETSGAKAKENSGSNNDDDGKKPKNPQKANDKQLKKNGHDAHVIKKEYLGKRAPISKYDLYVDKTTGRIWIHLKGGKGVPISTDYFMK